jgi:tetratricopeptide (TPR) repeat protein
LIVFVWAAQLFADDVETLKARAMQLLAAGDFRAALGSAQAIQRAAADEIAGYQLTAAAYLGLAEHEQAEKQLQWMLDLGLGKADAQGWYLVARFREATGDLAGALEAARLASARAADNDRPALEAYRKSLEPRPSQAGAAIRQIETRLKRSPSNPDLLDELAGAYLQMMRESGDGGYLDRADRLTAAILKTAPSHYGARRRRVEIALHRHRFQDVVDQAAALQQERPADSVSWGLAGDALMELGEYNRAAEAYQRMVDLRPGLASYIRIAFYRFVTGDAEGAIVMMRRAVDAGARETENVAWCVTALAGMLAKTGAAEQAGKTYRHALVLFPGYHPALAGLARLLAHDQPQEAIRLALQAQAKVPLPEYAALLARLYRGDGREDLAKEQLAMLDLADTLDQAAGEKTNRSLALAFATLGHRTDRALDLAQAEMKVRRDVYSWDALAWALFCNGRKEEAAAAMRKALAHGTPEPEFKEHARLILGATAE